MLLPITLLGPIRFLEGTANALRWAHHIGRCCCQLLHFGPLYLWKALPIHSDGPIASADAAADCFALAQYISVRHYQCIWMGLLHWRMLLPIALFWPNIFLGGTADALRWAHCIGGCCC